MEENLKNEIIELIKENSRLDSIEIGNSKTGSIKVYVNFDKDEEAAAKIQKAINVLKAKRGEVFE